MVELSPEEAETSGGIQTRKMNGYENESVQSWFPSRLRPSPKASPNYLKGFEVRDRKFEVMILSVQVDDC
jgi:hypothetical protein